MRKKFTKGQTLKYITEYLILCLSELKESELSEFDHGIFWAFVECLEIISMWSGFKKYRIEDIEKHFRRTNKKKN